MAHMAPGVYDSVADVLKSWRLWISPGLAGGSDRSVLGRSSGTISHTALQQKQMG